MLDTNNNNTPKKDPSKSTGSCVYPPVGVDYGKFIVPIKLADGQPDIGQACVVTDIVRDSEGIHQRWFFGTYHGEYWDTWGRGHIATHKFQYWTSQSACVPNFSREVEILSSSSNKLVLDTIPEDTHEEPENTDEVTEVNWKVMQEFIKTLEDRIEKLEEAQKCPVHPYQPYQPYQPWVLPYYPYVPDPMNPLGPVVTYDKSSMPDGVKYTTTCTAELSPIQGVINDPDGSIK